MLRTWLAQPHVGNSISIVSAVIAALGFGAAGWQLSRAEQTLRAANTYQVQKDGRELIESLYADSDFRSYVRGQTSDEKPTYENKIWLMLNFYQSVYRQSVADGLSSDYVRSFSEDFCTFVNRRNVGKIWDNLAKEERLSHSLVKMRSEWCR